MMFSPKILKSVIFAVFVIFQKQINAFVGVKSKNSRKSKKMYSDRDSKVCGNKVVLDLKKWIFKKLWANWKKN